MSLIVHVTLSFGGESFIQKAKVYYQLLILAFLLGGLTRIPIKSQKYEMLVKSLSFF